VGDSETVIVRRKLDQRKLNFAIPPDNQHFKSANPFVICSTEENR